MALTIKMLSERRYILNLNPNQFVARSFIIFGLQLSIMFLLRHSSCHILPSSLTALFIAPWHVLLTAFSTKMTIVISLWLSVWSMHAHFSKTVFLFQYFVMITVCLGHFVCVQVSFLQDLKTRKEMYLEYMHSFQ